METTTSTPETTRNDTGTARSPAVVATLSALLLLAASIAGQIAARADCPTVPPGLVIPLVVAGLVAWRTNRWTTGLALGVGLFIGTGAFLTPNTGDHLSSGDAALIASTAAALVALATLVIAGAAATLPRKGERH
ncbi:hypothetical protein [Streptomyces canus]|uniref:hypothetical protein n=1 Tax=Streptomyces canus TaxID=58343 RepID=UPI0027876D26|nr:hypothetical protein [Streptomyces canus]MDQ1067187.1 peptidoglycan/LPS O-acetylase OafA/YrhL [Streptomyces canus]